MRRMLITNRRASGLLGTLLVALSLLTVSTGVGGEAKSPPPPQTAESPNNTRVPPATQIVDSNGDVWTRSTNGSILRNGAGTAGTGSEILYCNRIVYVFGTDSQWYRWSGGWIPIGTTDPCGGPTPAAESPNNTRVPPATQIVDSTGAVWTRSTNGVILRNGAGTAGTGSEILYCNRIVYVFGTDSQWWRWTNGWIPIGTTDPCGGPTPTPAAESPNNARVPPATQIVDSTGAVWTRSTNGSILRNGAGTAGTGSEILYCNRIVYVFGTDSQWYRWSGGWTPIGTTDPCGGPTPTPSGESPSNTRVPPATQIVDSTGAVWTRSTNGAILRNGAGTSGAGSEILYCNRIVYVFGTDSQWYRWTNGWIPVGFTDPCASPTPTFNNVPVASGIPNPTAMAFAPDGRLFVCQQTGQLRVITNAGALLSDPFVTLTVNSAGERGLLGVAFDPNFASNRWVYVYYTATTPTIHNRVSRFTAAGDVAVAGSEVPILDLDNLSAATNHNGGAIHFGPDNKLYIAVGENANPANSQSVGNLLGKILRINSDGTIPSDNPTTFPGIASSPTGNNRAIWSVGLRNPYTFDFQPGSGRMLINDVGQNAWEEINDGIARSNYGWSICEGACSPPNANFRDPLFQYGHGIGETTGCAITGGAFYNPARITYPNEYVGKYFYAEFCSGWIRRFDPATGTSLPFVSGLSSPVDLKVGPDGNLYYLVRGGGGAVFKIVYR